MHSRDFALFVVAVLSMNLDVNTLFLVTIYVEAILGLLLLFAWVQNSEIYAVAWWGAAHLLRAGSISSGRGPLRRLCM